MVAWASLVLGPPCEHGERRFFLGPFPVEIEKRHRDKHKWYCTIRNRDWCALGRSHLRWLSQLSFENWIAVAGVAAAVGGTVVAVLVPRRAATRNSDRQYFIEYARRYQDLVSQAPPDIRDRNFEMAGRPDCERILQLANAYLDLCFEQWYLHQRGMITSELWSFWKSGMIAGFSRPAFQQAWIIVRADKKCDERFLLFVERSLSSGAARDREPSPLLRILQRRSPAADKLFVVADFGAVEKLPVSSGVSSGSSHAA